MPVFWIARLGLHTSYAPWSSHLRIKSPKSQLYETVPAPHPDGRNSIYINNLVSLDAPPRYLDSVEYII